ncbi:lipopolysaccharide biosynthesis protein [Sphingomonas sabuli]|uniref:Lipopolysaccharide biosynthesis protein n=1 Tax=Sphingomonas sabuli TaxID=2764186 RepID=A0A7G9L0C0_9SPHN|nr:lipopolysaccharide biosynthesis protein [Sphingomonas sabuli]QNM82069.1 lipopolysaccharide biosynthesis protein [Sphingomonas sabuli]
MSEAQAAAPKPTADLAALARGGRINFFGFCIRLAARLPFLFIAGRLYGAAALGRFAFAILTVEFAAQLATLGLKRGLAQQLARTDKPHACVAFDGLIVAAIGSLLAMVLLMAFPQAMFPNSEITGLEWLLPITIIALAWSDIMLAALAYRHDIASTVRARAIVEPGILSAAALAWAYISTRDGLIIAYVLSMIGALVASIIPFLKSYGIPRGWRPEPKPLWRMTRRNIPVAAADAVEWGSRRIDLAVCGLFFRPEIVGIYYVAQNVASLPAKLKTSFDPILGPVIARNVEKGDNDAVAKQVRQVGFWVIGAQLGVALALAIPGEAVMGLVGPVFVAGTAALAFLLAAEVVAAMAAVSEAALIYVARHRNMLLSFGMIVLQVVLSVGLVLIMRALEWDIMWQATGPAIGLMLALGFAAVAKSVLLRRILHGRVNGWRWPLIWAAAAATVVGFGATHLPEWTELVFGIPAILIAFGAVLWTKGFGPQDRELFRMSKKDIADLEIPAPGTTEDPVR